MGPNFSDKCPYKGDRHDTDTQEKPSEEDTGRCGPKPRTETATRAWQRQGWICLYGDSVVLPGVRTSNLQNGERMNSYSSLQLQEAVLEAPARTAAFTVNWGPGRV